MPSDYTRLRVFCGHCARAIEGVFTNQLPVTCSVLWIRKPGTLRPNQGFAVAENLKNTPARTYTDPVVYAQMFHSFFVPVLKRGNKIEKSAFSTCLNVPMNTLGCRRGSTNLHPFSHADEPKRYSFLCLLACFQTNQLQVSTVLYIQKRGTLFMYGQFP